MSDSQSEYPPSESVIFIARILLLAVTLVVWGTITVGIAFGMAELTTSYQYLTAILFLFLAHLWRLRTAPWFS